MRLRYNTAVSSKRSTSAVEGEQTLGFWQVTASVLAAMFGVQSQKNRERDFSKGKPIHFIVIGLAATALFALTVFGVVRLILSLASG